MNPMRVFFWVRDLLNEPVYLLLRTMQAYYHGRELALAQDNTNLIQPTDIILFCTLRNEAPRIPYFLDYYRSLGVRHFLFVNNGSSDNFQELVEDERDVSVWFTEASYKNSNFGMHWLNFLLRRYGTERWCLTCDPDEFLVFPYCNNRNLYELADFLESENRRSMACVMLDMYSDKSIDQTIYCSGDDPFKVAPYFDGAGYMQTTSWLRETWITGGVRRRIFFRDTPENSPALNKIPFVKWRWTYNYFLSMHNLMPRWLNTAHAEEHNSPTGALMHFKYFSLMKDKVAEEMERKQHWSDSLEYRIYNQHLSENNETFMYEKTIRYENWQQLIEKGFMNTGQWF